MKIKMKILMMAVVVLVLKIMKLIIHPNLKLKNQSIKNII
ncbi:hypothetical protein ACTFIV_005082 [Dictyostelium citrinum]